MLKIFKDYSNEDPHVAGLRVKWYDPPSTSDPDVLLLGVYQGKWKCVHTDLATNAHSIRTMLQNQRRDKSSSTVT
jgi:hypothetical protein